MMLLRDVLKKKSLWLPGIVFLFVLAVRAIPFSSVDRVIGFAIVMLASIVGQLSRDTYRLRWLAIIAVMFVEGFKANPNILAGIILLAPFSAATLAWLLMTQSMGAIVGLAVSFAFQLKVFARRWTALLAMTGAIIVVIVILAVHGDGERLKIWDESLRLFAARPIFGWGTGSYYWSLHSDTPEALAMNAVGRSGLGQAHNAILTIMAEQGSIGLVSLIAVLAPWMMAIAKSQHPAKWGILAFALQQLMDDTWLYPPVSLVLGLCLGTAMVKENVESN